MAFVLSQILWADLYLRTVLVSLGYMIYMYDLNSHVRY